MKSTASTKSLCNESFLSGLNQFSNTKKFWIAYSGGMDSSVLLHLFYSNKDKIRQNINVVYVHHGLQEEADDWAQFCKEQCQYYGFSFIKLQITEGCPKGESVEAWAREKRYALISEVMNNNDVLFTAHHQDDQVETFFLQALRGAGPRGLASMPEIRKKSNTLLVRPLLNYSRNDLKEYAAVNKINWQEDKSNSNHRYDRNYFRHQLAPVIEERWPAYRETISRLIDNQNECRLLLNELAAEDLERAMHKNSLKLDVVKTLSVTRQKNLIFFWLQELNLKTPGSRNINKIISDIINSAPDKSPCVNWEDVEVRRYRNSLYAAKVLEEFEANIEYKWNPEEVLNISGETLSTISGKGKGISKDKIKNAELVIRFRQGGEKIKPDGFSHTKTVKQLFQERSVLPWLRDRIPLIYIDDKLIAIPGFCIDERYLAAQDDQSWDIVWSGFDKVIQS
ncbi:MAG: tRNA lysidine(34) synthetase TilS [Proteobacteria bacterium]|nr:tRNA lysidine(34) synthetase TilS [Pseudomonadota bacterium]NOG60830.1 tRNA lysidine(34) synthetase TilS [Pseudomonadota bacterium]